MARPKSYEREKSIERACYAFWASGYRSLGIRDLHEKAGLNQFAIRTEFGGKESLYLEALKFYADTAEATAMAPLKEGGIADIIGFLEGLVTSGSPTCSKWGCLIVNTGIENAHIGSERLSSAVQNYWNRLEAYFTGALRRDQSKGLLDQEADIETLARGLIPAVMGIHALNRARGAHNAGAPLVSVITAYLKALEAG